MAFNYPYGDTQQLNLEWFINKFHEMVAEWQTAESGISGALQAEIDRVEAAMTDLYNARDAAINAKDDAVSAKNAAAGSATAAYGSQTAAASSAAAAMTNALKSEGHAVGEQNGTPVSSGSPYYEDNSKYYANQAASAVTDAQQEVANAHTQAENAAASAQHAQDLVDSLPSDYSDLLHQVGDQIEGEGTELSGAIVSFDDGVEGMPLREITVDIDPVQAGSGDPSPNNIRHITGWTEANVIRTDMNVWDEELELGNIDSTTGAPTSSSTTLRTKNFISIKPNTEYYCYCGSINTNMRARFYDANKNYIGYNNALGNEVFWNKAPTSSNRCITPDNAYYMKFTTHESYGTTYLNDISINYPIEYTSYYAYTGQTIPITFPNAAGTVYGGTLENKGTNTWKLTVDYVEVDGGSLNWSKITGNNYRNFETVSLPNTPKYNSSVASVISSMYKSESYNSASTNADEYVWIRSNLQICVKDTSKGSTMTAADFKTAMSGVQFVYQLATPLTYTLAYEAVTLLKDINNIWADTGDLELTYGAYLSVLSDGLQTKTNKTLIAPVLDDMIADTALSVNDLRIVGDTLYKVTASIANGGTLIVGTNVTATTIGDLITDLLNA